MGGTALGGSTMIMNNETQDQLSQHSQMINFNFIDEYLPESQEIDLEKLRGSQNLKKKRYVDAIYFGEINEKKRNGKGVMKYKSGRVYEGDWLDDLRHGRGYERYANGNLYLGDFHTGKAHGKGYYTWNNSKEVYDGEWVRGVRQGYGIWKNAKGDTYMGEWINGRAVGYGVFTWSNGDKYEGEWNMSLKHGKGVDYFNNGDNYRGEYKNGKPEGFGVYTWANGSTYEGYFAKGLKTGKGKWKKCPEVQGGPRNEYNGEYQNDKKCGQGEFKWASGNHYKGEYKDDERDGYGEMTWTDGSKYIGQWVKGIQHGYGKMIFPDGTFKEGYFDNNIFVGHLPSKQLLRHEQTKNQYKTPIKNNGYHHQSDNRLTTEIKLSNQLMSKRLGSNKSQRTLNKETAQGVQEQYNNINILNKMQMQKANSTQYSGGIFKNPNMLMGYSNGFQSTQKLQNHRFFSPNKEIESQTNINLVNPTYIHGQPAKYMVRNQSQILQTIQKPKFDKIHPSPPNNFLINTEKSGSTYGNGNHQYNDEQSFEKPRRTKKILAKSKRSINTNSQKHLPMGGVNLQGTRFSDPNYYHLVPQYNLGLS